MTMSTIWDGQDHRGNHWIISRYSDAMPDIIRWVKYGTRGKLLDQTSRWRGDHWCGGRWRPSHPIVPEGIRREVESVLQCHESAN